MQLKDPVALIGIAVTFAVSAANFVYTLRTNRRSSFVNTVTASRLKWIDSLRDKVSEFIAISTQLVAASPSLDDKERRALQLQRDTLLHQTVLHLNPRDREDQEIRALMDRVRAVADSPNDPEEVSRELLKLRNVAAAYLKKEWNRVKVESTAGGS